MQSINRLAEDRCLSYLSKFPNLSFFPFSALIPSPNLDAPPSVVKVESWILEDEFGGFNAVREAQLRGIQLLGYFSSLFGGQVWGGLGAIDPGGPGFICHLLFAVT